MTKPSRPASCQNVNLPRHFEAQRTPSPLLRHGRGETEDFQRVAARPDPEAQGSGRCRLLLHRSVQLQDPSTSSSTSFNFYFLQLPPFQDCPTRSSVSTATVGCVTGRPRTRPGSNMHAGSRAASSCGWSRGTSSWPSRCWNGRPSREVG